VLEEECWIGEKNQFLFYPGKTVFYHKKTKNFTLDKSATLLCKIFRVNLVFYWGIFWLAFCLGKERKNTSPHKGKKCEKKII